MQIKQGLIFIMLLIANGDVMARFYRGGGEGSRITCCFIDIFCAAACFQRGLRALHPGRPHHKIRHQKHLMRLLRSKRAVSRMGK